MAAQQETQNSRLDRIEEKIDKLSDAMIALARAEERLIAIERNHHADVERMNRFSRKLDVIEDRVADGSRTIAVITKLFWLVIGSALVAAGTHFLM